MACCHCRGLACSPKDSGLPLMRVDLDVENLSLGVISVQSR